MGKGSNVQKAQAARERNQKKLGKSPEERAAASAKAKADAAAYICPICKQTFMISVNLNVLYTHVMIKHPGTDPTSCFPQLCDFDPNDPKGLKAAAKKKEEAAQLAAKKKKALKKAGADLNLLDAGLSAGKKKGKKR